jgi:dipeptidase D
MNAIKAVARILLTASQRSPIQLVAFEGGEVFCIIPRFAKAVVAVPVEAVSETIAVITAISATVFAEFRETDNVPIFNIANNLVHENQRALTIGCTRKLLNVICVYQTGVLRMSPLFPGTVDTSDNLAMIKIHDATATISIAPRSITQSLLDQTYQRFRVICEMSGLEYVIRVSSEGAPWTPKTGSRLVELMEEAFQEVTGAKKDIGITPCTLEVGGFLGLGYDFDCVSLCPSVPKAHTIGEFVSLTKIIEWRQVVLRLLSKVN